MALKKLENRGPVAAAVVVPPEPRADDELVAQLRRRAGEARRLPIPGDVPCRDCWKRGRDAAIGAVLGVPDVDVVDAVDATCRLEAPSYHRRAEWLRGRDAALAYIQGEGEIEGE